MIVHFLTSISVNKSGNVFCKEFLSCTRCTSLNKRRKQQQNLNESHFPFQIHSISQNVCQKAYKNWDKCSKSCHFHNNINKSRIVVSKDVLPILKKQLKSKERWGGFNSRTRRNSKTRTFIPFARTLEFQKFWNYFIENLTNITNLYLT